jgi:hypothetical protein
MMHKFSWPDTMPAGMEDLKFMNVLSPNNEFFDAFIERLVSHLKSKVSIIRKIKRLWFIFAVIIMVILFFIFYNSKYEFQRQLNQITTTENFAFNDWNPWYMGLIDSTAVSINLVHQEQVKTFGELFLKDIDELEKDENTQPVVSKIQELLKTQ